MVTKGTIHFLFSGNTDLLVPGVYRHPEIPIWMLDDVYRHVSTAAVASGDSNNIAYTEFRHNVAMYMQVILYHNTPDSIYDKDLMLQKCLEQAKHWFTSVHPKYYTTQPFLTAAKPSSDIKLAFAYYNIDLWYNADPEKMLTKMNQDDFTL
jgi:hypothetical protein